MVTTRGADGSAKKRHYKEVESSPEGSVVEEEDEAVEDGGVAAESSSPFQQQQQQQHQQLVALASTNTKKRPYRRTKRPLGYNDKSSITTTTETFHNANVSAYDAVLQESHDLLQAATEAQQLGRLKMSASYLLLLHTRLVGLGKRFDKAVAVAERGEGDHHHHHEGGASPRTQRRQQQQAAQQALQSLLPNADGSTIELDTAMMEHLARAAAELHAKRTGKTLHSTKYSTVSGTEFLAQTANQKGVTNAATVHGVAKAVQAIEQQEARYWNKTATTATTTTTQHASSANQLFAAGPKTTATTANNETDDPYACLLESTPAHRNKPATVAMRTVPYANCNARSLLHGAPFYESNTSSNINRQQEEEEAANGGTDDEHEHGVVDAEEDENEGGIVVGTAAAFPSHSNEDEYNNYHDDDNNNNNNNNNTPPESSSPPPEGNAVVAAQATQTAVV